MTAAISRLLGAIDRHRVVAAGLLALVVVAPAIATLLGAAGEHWYPAGDMAQAELHVRGIWAHLPLVGAAGRITSDAGVQGSHPGPSLWFAMYPVYLLFGRSSLGLLVSVVSVHLGAAWLAIWMGGRRGGHLLMLCLTATLTLVVRSGGIQFAIQPWNPWLAVLPFAAFVLACWLAVVERPAWLVLAVVLGSHCAQCHAGYLPLALALGGATSAAALWIHRRDLGWRTPVAAAGAAVVMWVLPVIDQLTRSPGNMTILVQHFVGPAEPYLGTGTALRIVASELSLFGPWLTGPMLLERHPVFALLTLALWAAAVVVAARRRDRDALVLHGLLLLAALVGTMSVLRIFGPFLEYTIQWWWVLTALVLAGSTWTLLRPAPAVADPCADDDTAPLPAAPRRATRVWLASAAVLLFAIVMSMVGSVELARAAELPGVSESRLIGTLADDVERGLVENDPDGRYLVRWHDPVALGATGFGLLLEMERRGLHLGVDEAFGVGALPHRVLPESEATAVMWVVLGPRIEDFRAAGFLELAYTDPRTPAERARFDELDEALLTRLVEIGRPELADALHGPTGSAALLFIRPPLPQDVADMVAEYVQLRLDAAVFLVPVGAATP